MLIFLKLLMESFIEQLRRKVASAAHLTARWCWSHQAQPDHMGGNVSLQTAAAGSSGATLSLLSEKWAQMFMFPIQSGFFFFKFWSLRWKWSGVCSATKNSSCVKISMLLHGSRRGGNRSRQLSGYTVTCWTHILEIPKRSHLAALCLNYKPPKTLDAFNAKANSSSLLFNEIKIDGFTK